MISKMKETRFFRGFTLDDLFIKTGIPQSKLSRIERGIFTPKQEEKKRIAKALEASASILFPEG